MPESMLYDWPHILLPDGPFNIEFANFIDNAPDGAAAACTAFFTGWIWHDSRSAASVSRFCKILGGESYSGHQRLSISEMLVIVAALRLWVINGNFHDVRRCKSLLMCADFVAGIQSAMDSQSEVERHADVLDHLWEKWLAQHILDCDADTLKPKAH